MVLIWVLIPVAISMVLAVYILLARKGKSEDQKPLSKRVVISGISGSGKTTLFYTLAKGKSPQTVTSLKLSTATFIAKGTTKKAEYVDVPGHEQFKRGCIQKLENASAWIYVVDSSQKDAIYKSALDLYDYFTYVKIRKLGVPLLILANKQDQEAAISPDNLEKQLKREIERIKRTRTAFTEQSEGIDDYLKNQTSVFSFEDVKGLRVSFAKCSASNNSLEELTNWIQENLKL